MPCECADSAQSQPKVPLISLSTNRPAHPQAEGELPLEEILRRMGYRPDASDEEQEEEEESSSEEEEEEEEQGEEDGAGAGAGLACAFCGSVQLVLLRFAFSAARHL